MLDVRLLLRSLLALVPLCLLPFVGAAEPPALEIVQTLKGGEDGLPKPFITAYTIAIKGNFVYVGGNNISAFKRELPSGKLTFLGEVAETKERLSEAFPKAPKMSTDRKTCILRVAGGRLYAIPQAGTGMAWYDIDAQTGKLTEKGIVECPPCFHAVVSPDQKDLYVMTNPYAKRNAKMAVSWYHLEADGKPVRSGEVTGKGLGGCDQTPYENLLQMAPDGKHLYAASGDEVAVACIERKPSGEIAYKSTTELEPITPAPKSGKYPWSATLISPDGKWVYAHLWKYAKPVDNRIGIYKRNAETGELTLQETITGEQNVLANRRGWQCTTFLPDGNGFFGHYDLGLWTFRYDAQTGHLLEPKEVKESKGYKANVAYDLENGLLYMGGVWIVEGGIQDGFRVLKMAAKK